MEYEYVYERCPRCEAEVKLKAVLDWQICPNCGKPILSCAMCEDMKCETCKFFNG